ncbi:hypothetical protein RKD23_007514 [Streptomyces sp. SAI-170]|uniref:hypothetical protein n=1 Tax=Streptomyces sp. SAI-170 TaxID=3377729 RepID=UPI003C7DFC37
MRNELKVADAIRAELGTETVDRLRNNLVPVDCLTCGEEITDADVLNLAIDDVNVGLFATLHHQECRPSAWVHHTPEQAQNLKVNLTWRACVVDWQGGTPVLLVNPSCEAAVLIRTNALANMFGKAWSIGTLNRCASVGFVPPGQASSARSVEGLKARLEPTRLTVLAESGPLEGTSWHAEISAAGFSKVQTAGKVLVGVTTAIDPKDDAATEARIKELSRNDEVLFSLVPVERPEPKLDPEALMAVMELVRRGMGSVPSEEHIATTLMLYQLGAIPRALPRPTGRDLLVVVSMVAGLCWGSGPVHVMTHDDGTARSIMDNCRTVFGHGGFAVSRVGEPSFTSERRITIGTYQEIAAARARFDSGPRPSAGLLPIALAVDPVPDSERDAVRSRYRRLIEL